MSEVSTHHNEGLDLEWDLADRLRKSLRVADVGVGEMAAYLEVSRNTVGSWINGHHTPSPATVKQWALRCGIPYSWFRDGSTGGTNPPGDQGTPPTSRLVPLAGQRVRHLRTVAEKAA